MGSVVADQFPVLSAWRRLQGLPHRACRRSRARCLAPLGVHDIHERCDRRGRHAVPPSECDGTATERAHGCVACRVDLLPSRGPLPDPGEADCHRLVQFLVSLGVAHFSNPSFSHLVRPGLGRAAMDVTVVYEPCVQGARSRPGTSTYICRNARPCPSTPARRMHVRRAADGAAWAQRHGGEGDLLALASMLCSLIVSHMAALALLNQTSGR
mmetsp:Transcript_5566/g.12053  ORF Transcript_5566/g.12053 Transcript_5566/m.12053 type:complete len:212 (+) Transcript_5566:2-637(+)